MQSYGRGI
jgi:hypothetical protein